MEGKRIFFKNVDDLTRSTYLCLFIYLFEHLFIIYISFFTYLFMRSFIYSKKNT